MSKTKTKSYNLALSALLIAEQIIDVATETGTKISILNQFWDLALEATLQDLDLDSLSQPIALELLAQPESGPWCYIYKYPTNCAFLRRIESSVITDKRTTHISKRTGLYDGQKVIYTNQVEAVGECIPIDAPLEAMNAMALMALSYRLAIFSAPLLVGKGAKTLRKEIETHYLVAKFEAQETDRLENFNYEADDQRSEFVEERIS